MFDTSHIFRNTNEITVWIATTCICRCHHDPSHDATWIPRAGGKIDTFHVRSPALLVTKLQIALLPRPCRGINPPYASHLFQIVCSVRWTSSSRSQGCVLSAIPIAFATASTPPSSLYATHRTADGEQVRPAGIAPTASTCSSALRIQLPVASNHEGASCWDSSSPARAPSLWLFLLGLEHTIPRW